MRIVGEITELDSTCLSYRCRGHNVSSSILPRFHYLYTNGVIGLTETTDRSMQSQLSCSHVIDMPRRNEPDQSEKVSPIPLHMLANGNTTYNQPIQQSTMQKVDTYRKLDELHRQCNRVGENCVILSSPSPFPLLTYILNHLMNDMSSTYSESYDFSPDTASKIRSMGRVDFT